MFLGIFPEAGQPAPTIEIGPDTGKPMCANGWLNRTNRRSNPVIDIQGYRARMHILFE